MKQTTRPSCSDDPNISQSLPAHPTFHHSGRNVFPLLARREISPRTKHLPRRLWGEASKGNAGSSTGHKSEAVRDARHGLISWVEAESLWNLSAKYCPLVPSPRSTIAAAFSPDGRMLASTHGDHSVKIIDCRTGSCLKVLSGHRRTPWVVRFHPEHPDVLASGSLDHEVRIWDANTSECIGSRDFYRPIASIAFHAEGELLAVASGHKLYIWHYNGRGETSSPTIVLKTRRSLRAVHFHPRAAPFLLTAEVSDLDSSDSSMTSATSLGYLHYPPPAVFVANVHFSDRFRMAAELPRMSLPFSSLPTFGGDNSRADLQHANRPVGSSSVQVESSASMQFETDANAAEQYVHMGTPMEISPVVPSSSYPVTEDTGTVYFLHEKESALCDTAIDAMETTEVKPSEGNQQRTSSNLDTFVLQCGGVVPGQIPSRLDRVSVEFRPNPFLPSRDPTCWELPFLQGWLIGQSQAGIPPILPLNGGPPDYSSGYLGVASAILTSDLSTCNVEAPPASSAMPSGNGRSGDFERFGLRHHTSHSRLISASGFSDGASATPHDGRDHQPIISRIHSELATSLAAASAELPCTVKLRIWTHDIKNPCAPLNPERCRLTIPHVVLCSEMGAHFSPCGRFLAACVACMLPHMDADLGLQTQVNQDATGAASSPTRHPISAHQIIYELRIYSLEEATFGSVLVSRAIRAAHCLTSIQFSPTSEHILLAYGRRHGSLLKSIVIDGETTLPIYTILEVYRVSDMELVRVLPSAEDEVNVACFHPLAGGGLIYGTKEGRLRVLQYDGALGINCTRPNFFLEETWFR